MGLITHPHTSYNQSNWGITANISQDPARTFHGAWIWKLDVLPKIANFLWLCIHKSVLVKDVLASRGIIEDKTCPLCKNQPETIENLLRECDFA